MSPVLTLVAAALGWELTVTPRFPHPHPYVFGPTRALVGYANRATGLGDVDGDGFEDLAIAADRAAAPVSPADPSGPSGNGAGWVGVHLGGPSGPAPRPAFELWGESPGATFGASLDGGDLDGDGFAELIVGAPGDNSGASDGGRVTVFFGGPSGPGVPGPGARTPWTYEGRVAGGRLGLAVAHLGDLDGPVAADEVRRGELAVASADKIEVFFGQADGLPTQPGLSLSPPFTREDRVVSLHGAGDLDGDGHGDFIAAGATQAIVWYGAGRNTPRHVIVEGAMVMSPGDLDGDGKNDLVARHPDGLALLGGDGRALVADDGPLDPAAYRSIAAAGDLNGDGYADFVAAGADTDGHAQVGFFAGNASGARCVGTWPSSSAVLAAAGDLDGRGFGGVIVAETSRSRVLVVRGASAGPANPIPLPLTQPGILPLDLRIEGLLDVDGDGFDDLAIGLPESSSTSPGLLAVFRGSPAGPLPSFETTSVEAGEALGASIAGGIDMNGDGYADFMVGASQHKTSTSSSRARVGRLDLWYGSPRGPTRETASARRWELDGASYGLRVAEVSIGVGDLNGDGLGDAVTSDSTRVEPNRSPRVIWGDDVAPWQASAGIPRAGSVGGSLGRGDFDGDGLADLLVGGLRSPPHLVFGSAGTRFLERLTANDGERGFGVAGLGDIDGDGRDDVGLVPQRSCETSAGFRLLTVVRTGFPLRPEWHQRLLPRPSDTCFASGVVALGDLDRDGFGDVAIAGGWWSRPPARLAIHRGTPLGLEARPSWELSDLDEHFLFGGHAAGDFDGDGFVDFAFGRRWTRTADADPIVWWVRGNGGHGTQAAYPARPMLRDAEDFAPIVPGGGAPARDRVAVASLVRSPFGRQRLWLEVEVVPVEADFGSDEGLLARSEVVDTSTASRLFVVVRGLEAGQVYRWRARVRYDAAQSAPQGTSRWYYGGPLGQRHGAHFRTRANLAPIAEDDTYAVASDELFLAGQATSLLANDRDSEDDPLSTSLLRPARRGTVTVARDGAFLYQPEPGFVGRDSFVYLLTDRFGASAEGTAWLTVSPLAACGVATQAQCEEGDVFVHLRMADGAIQSLRCRVGADGAPVCDTDQGIARLGWPICH